MEPSIEEHIYISRDVQMQSAIERLSRIDDEVLAGYKLIQKHKQTVTFFGSARTQSDDPYYKKAYELGDLLAKNNYAVVTGGGNGIMAAANQGAHDAGGASIGFNIELPHEQTLNPFTTESYAFSHFAPRKITMTLFAHAYVYFPGGFGTLDELTEILTLTQTHKMPRAPIILFDKAFWKSFDSFVRSYLLQRKLITPGDEELYTMVDDVDEAMELIAANQTYEPEP